MKGKTRLLVFAVCVLGAFGVLQPVTAVEYKLREAAEYVKARDGQPIPHVATSEHFALKWGDKNDKNWKIDDAYIQGALKWFEHVRDVYMKQVGWPYIKSEKDHYKINIYISETGLKPFEHGYAFGFPDPDGYGVLDADPSCMVWGHGASAHELGHAAEAETGNFRDSDYVGFFWECCAQFLAVQANPGDAPSLDLFCDMCQFDFATAVNWHQYANWPLMEYFAEKPGYGNPFVVNLWMQKAIHQNEDPISKLKRLNNISADQWADLVGDYAKRNATFNSYRYGEKYKVALGKRPEKSLGRWKMALEPIKGREGWFRIPYAAAPMQTAFNVIPLTPTSDRISVEFKGLVDEVRKSDWRATIVVVDKNGKDRYSNSVKSGATSIRLQSGEKEAYLVVAAAPHIYDAIGFLRDYRTQERFPYEVKITGADPKGKDPVKVTAPGGVAGAPHANGGGFVASTAQVAATAYVGPNAMVLDSAQVRDAARVEDYAVVSKDAVVSGNAIVSGHALVTDKAAVSSRARIRDYARIYDSSKIDGSARFFDYAAAKGSPHVYDNAVARGHSNINGGNLHGTATFIGATNPGADIKDCTKGIYWKYMGQEDCDKAFDMDGLYANYDFNRINNLLLRDSIARSDGFLNGGPEYVREGFDGQYCLAFNGKDQYVEMPKNLSDLRDFDLSVYVKWAGGEAGQRVFDFGRDALNCCYFTPKSASGKAAFVIVRGGETEIVEAPQALAEGKWVKVEISVKGGAAKLLFGDQETATGTVTANLEDLRADSNYLARGQEGGFFKGQIDELKVWIRDSY